MAAPYPWFSPILLRFLFLPSRFLLLRRRSRPLQFSRFPLFQRLSGQMDKAALLGEAVQHVRELRGRADDATEGVDVVSGEGDEVGVEENYWRPPGNNGAPTDDDRRWRQQRRVRAWVCRDDRTGLMSDLGRAVRSVSALPVRAEIATVGGRTRGVLELDVCDVAAATDNDKAVALSTLRAVLLNREELLTAAEGIQNGLASRPRTLAL